MIGKLEIPAEGYQFTPPITVNYLTGGLALMVGQNRLAMLASPGGLGLLPFSIIDRNRHDNLLDGQAHLRVIGCSRSKVAEEMKDVIPGNFSLSSGGDHQSCEAKNQMLHWSGVSTTLHQDARDSEALVARRVSLQINVCLNRFERLSAAYRTVLLALSSRPLYEQGSVRLTKNKYSTFIGGEYRSCLNELYSLRDALMALVFRLKYK